MIAAYTLVHLLWLIGMPADAPPARGYVRDIPTLQQCEEVKIGQFRTWARLVTKQTGYCLREESA